MTMAMRGCMHRHVEQLTRRSHYRSLSTVSALSPETYTSYTEDSTYSSVAIGLTALGLGGAGMSLVECKEEQESRKSWLLRGKFAETYAKEHDKHYDKEKYGRLEPGKMSRKTMEENPRSFGAGAPMKGAHGHVDIAHNEEDDHDAEAKFRRKQQQQQRGQIAKEVGGALGGNIQPGVKKPGLPTYSLEEVQKHTDENSGIWVVYKQGVYDITDFRYQHPGGSSKVSHESNCSLICFFIH